MSRPDSWTFLTHHTHVLFCIARDPELRMWEVAEKVGITERGVHKLVAELIQEGYLTRCKGWRRNRYEVPTHLPLRHPLEAHRPVQALLSLLDEDLPGAKAAETG